MGNLDMTDEEKAEEFIQITTQPWPLEPFLPMKKRRGGGKMPDNGFLYRHRLDRIYLGMVGDIVHIDEKFTEKGIIRGLPHLEYSAQIKDDISPSQIEVLLEKTPKEIYGDLKTIIDAGWMVD